MNARSKESFGAAAVRLGYVSQGDVSQALDEQARRRSGGGPNALIGALLAEKGLLTPQQVTAVLQAAAQADLPLTEDGIRLAARVRVLHAAASNLVGCADLGTGPDGARLATELAVALAVMEQGQVLLIDAHLRQPSLAGLLGVPGAPGLMEAIAAGGNDCQLIRTAVGGLSLLPCGEVGPDFLATAMSPQAGSLFDAVRSRFRYVIVHLGPLLLLPEAAVFASRCDGVLATARAGTANKGELRDLHRLLSGLQVGLSGVVLTQQPPRARRA